MTRRAAKTGRHSERGAALVVAILVLAILTVIGIALMLITSTESRIAANEWAVNRAFYASDAGIRWASAQMSDANPTAFMGRPEFGTPFGTVLFQLPSHRHGAAGFFTGGTDADIQVRIVSPSYAGRRPYISGAIQEQGEKGLFMYAFEVRSNAGQNDAFLQYSKALVADIEMGPMPARTQFP